MKQWFHTQYVENANGIWLIFHNEFYQEEQQYYVKISEYFNQTEQNTFYVELNQPVCKIFINHLEYGEYYYKVSLNDRLINQYQLSRNNLTNPKTTETTINLKKKVKIKENEKENKENEKNEKENKEKEKEKENKEKEEIKEEKEEIKENKGNFESVQLTDEVKKEVVKVQIKKKEKKLVEKETKEVKKLTFKKKNIEDEKKDEIQSPSIKEEIQPIPSQHEEEPKKKLTIAKKVTAEPQKEQKIKLNFKSSLVL